MAYSDDLVEAELCIEHASQTVHGLGRTLEAGEDSVRQGFVSSGKSSGAELRRSHQRLLAWFQCPGASVPLLGRGLTEARGTEPQGVSAPLLLGGPWPLADSTACV